MTSEQNAAWRRFLDTMVPSREALAQRAALCRALWPADCTLAEKTAEELRNNIFLFQLPWDMEQTQKPVQFPAGKIDWGYMAGDDQEFIFQMNRHRYWISLGQAYALTGDEAYAECFVAQLMDWLDKEPWREEAANTTWRTLDAGLRADYWVRAMALCAHSPAVTDEVAARFIDGLAAHADRLGQNKKTGFSYKSNWGVMEYTGLYVIAWLLGREGDFERARHFLREDLHIQIMDDGMQWEASCMYHNEVLASYLEALRAARLFGDDTLFGEEELALISKAAHATLALKTPAHCQPMTGDSDRTDVRDLLSEAALLLGDGALKAGGYARLDYESIWLFGAEADKRYRALPAVPGAPGAVHLEASGQVVLRSGWDEKADWLYFKNGPLGGGHGHQDKLHVGLWLDGEEVLADAGRFTYTDTPERYALKAAASHNVPMADACEFSDSVDSWTYRALPQATPNRVVQKGEYLFIEGAHTGYADRGLLVCRRVLAVGTDIFLINDTFVGPAPGEVSQQFLFAPDIRLTAKEGALTGHGKVCRFAMHSFAAGAPADIALGSAPFSAHYNLLEETASARVRAEGVASLTTVLARTDTPVRITPTPVHNDAYGLTLRPDEAEGYVIEACGRRLAVVLLHHDVGNQQDCNGICGAYGLGRTMVCDLDAQPRRMTVLQW